ncbi:MAG: hypothetical protein QGF74_03095 [Candidatus Nanoarchaeia archaeon]|jgi:hypothetical protein|nr:hypothetical protein [Candidatus Nanoarchaeia archaeon]|tara:strand:+ start:1063 stop:1440 length:378 start_codon:yes stop_codon:yes gene_type:complete
MTRQTYNKKISEKDLTALSKELSLELAYLGSNAESARLENILETNSDFSIKDLRKKVFKNTLGVSLVEDASGLLILSMGYGLSQTPLIMATAFAFMGGASFLASGMIHGGTAIKNYITHYNKPVN